MYPILDAFGVQDIVLGSLYIGGCTIETHTINAASNATVYDYRKIPKVRLQPQRVRVCQPHFTMKIGVALFDMPIMLLSLAS